MLILTRRVGEVLMVGKDIKVKVCAVKGNQVRIGIDAPNNVQVDREEIFLRKVAEEEVAQGNATTARA